MRKRVKQQKKEVRDEIKEKSFPSVLKRAWVYQSNQTLLTCHTHSNLYMVYICVLCLLCGYVCKFMSQCTQKIKYFVQSDNK